VEADVEEREQSQQTPQAHLPRDPECDAKGRQGKAGEQQPERGVAEQVRGVRDRIGAEPIGEESIQEQQKGRQRNAPDCALQRDAGSPGHGIRSTASGPFRHTAPRPGLHSR